ncbi:MAG: AAA family ATPase [Alphaproteobacteria bacterium]|nr:AAA family ATPase [Alphaproteobacteria bacterium]
MARENGVFKFEQPRFNIYDDHDSDNINAMEYWHVILRQKKYVFFAFIIISLIGLPIIYSLTPIYQATAKVVVDSNQSKLVGLDVESVGGASIDFKVNTEVEIIKSNKVHLRTIRDLQLWNSVDYNRKSLKEKLFSLFATEETESANSIFRTYSDLSGQDLMGYLKALSTNISVSRSRGTNVIAISALSPSAERAADIANNITRSYLSEKVESKADSVREAANVLRNQLNKLSEEIQDYEHQVENFIQEQSSKVNSPEVRLELEKLRAEITIRVDSKLTKTLQLSQIDRATVSRDYSLLTSLSGDQQADALYAQYQTISQQLRAPVLNNNDRFSLEQELAKIDANFSELAINLSNNLNEGINDTQAKIDTVRTARQKLFSEQNLPQDVSLALYRLTTDIESKRKLYKIESSKYSEVEQKIGILIPDVRVIATAFPSRNPIKPNKKLLTVALVIAALFAGVVLAIIRDKLIGGFTSSEQVKSVLGIRPISIIPRHEKAGEDNAILNSPLSRFSESIRMLRVGLDNSKPEIDENTGQLARVIAITSTLPKEGKTTTSLSLARSYALTGKKTILVDLDFRHPAVYSRLGLEKSYGLQDFIRDDADISTLDNVMYFESATGLYVALSGSTQKMATDILVQSASLDMVLEKFKAEYDIVIIDTPPVGFVVDTQIIAQKVDQIVYAIKHASTSQKNILAGMNYIHRAKDTLPISTIITQQDDAQASHYGMHGAEYSYYYSN